ncbi:uncharacterized protein NECHADRAFT_88871 [Fusarium vanettenii 77-13-4]|uniref:Uncharacterized protein n=1 Tax=Fusarium vanettenii (strain ATCC MYA-4622 / CBS 123669 / FGSC 9596 / NRRL 45880 / 77-13-4) TaxID=660122 RepID=C7ZN55_FUSV7|nr:uncharacterized protein NECHADRAFT_88871 [Fusarium vanettenii 77-13-4]EEU34562.1 hypothetical protein NECHADRAFT_88871 [Fusarium vanettenii 77-13-4]
MSHVAVQTCCAFIAPPLHAASAREYLFEMTSFPVAWTRPQTEVIYVAVDEPILKRTGRTEAEPSVESSNPTLATSSGRQRPKKATGLAEQQHQTAIDEQLKKEEETLRQKIKVVTNKVEKRHSKSFKLRERRRHIWETIEDYDSSVIVNQRHIVGLNGGDREHSLKRLERVDRKLHETNDEVERIQNALDLNREKVDGLVHDHADLLVQLARVETIRRDRVVPHRNL